MEDEYLDILHEDGSKTDQIGLKSEVHSKGYYHNTVHVWIYNELGQILLQQRSFQKLICPGLWDVSAAGHVDAGESLHMAASREVFEELGITIDEDKLELLGSFKSFQTYKNGFIDNEFHNTYIYQIRSEINDFKIAKDEVEAIKFVSITEFNELLDHSKTNNHFVSTNRPYYLKVLNGIETKIKTKNET